MNAFQIKITLSGSKPPIWRRIIVKDNISFYEFHSMIQAAMGWYNAHLHAFDLGFIRIGIPFDDGFEDSDEDGKKIKLKKYFNQEGSKMPYIYDFGDYWEHNILLEKVLPVNERMVYPYCVKGKSNCPPEDCGGIWGFYELVKTIKNPKHPDYKDMKEWLGADYDPTDFDIEEVNKRLANWKSMDIMDDFFM